MFVIYFNKEKELGFCFHHFYRNEHINVFKTFDFDSQKKAYVLEHKVDVVLSNLETFYSEYADSPELKNELQKTAVERLDSLVVWGLENKDKPLKLFKTILQCEPFMVTVVNSLTGEDRSLSIMHWKLIINFLKEEIKILSE